ncbi:D-glycero-beta-D-manno-heptose-7-phosphate kinase, partial [bacterium]|nr:D-glycero-beta-D-manno-heptose-7-phosphate kinase [bacterium]
MPRRLSRQRLDELLNSLRGRRVLIVGDVMLDLYVWVQVRRIRPEAPVPVVEVTEENLRLGGAANVARTITVLGGEPLLLGVVGDDGGAE